jgi:hypothetical protein
MTSKIDVNACPLKRSRAVASKCRDMTPAEGKAWSYKSQELRDVDNFKCPHCQSMTGVVYTDEVPRIETCAYCAEEFFAWVRPAKAFITAKLIKP